jgi:cytochrome b561
MIPDMDSATRKPSRLRDTSSGYGWLSIALHWITGIVVLALLFLGSSISSAAPEERTGAVLLHTSIAISSYAFLWARIVWRFAQGHPGPLPNQRRAFFLIGRAVHYATIVAMALMLVSGPLMAWSAGQPIGVFDWFSIPSPIGAHYALHDFLLWVHSSSAIVIVIGVVLHLGGVYKHAAFDQDGTFGKMLTPAKSGEDRRTPDGAAASAVADTAAR